MTDPAALRVLEQAMGTLANEAVTVMAGLRAQGYRLSALHSDEPTYDEKALTAFGALMDAIATHEQALTEKVGPNEAKRLAQPLYDFAWTTPLRLNEKFVPGAGQATEVERQDLRWARWIEQQTRRTDWACHECVDADVSNATTNVIPGFVCVWHEARTALVREGEKP